MKRRTQNRLYKHLLRQLLGRRQTISYPAQPLRLSVSYRGQIVVDIDHCRGCGLCERDCPAEALQVERIQGGGVRVVLLGDRCSACGLCTASCRQGAIRQLPAFMPGVTSRAQLRTEWLRQGEGAAGE